MRRLSHQMRVSACVGGLAMGLLFLSSCHGTKEEKQSMTIGMDEDYKVKTYYEGSGWSGMSKFMSAINFMSEVGDSSTPTKLTFLADKGYYSLLSTQHYSIWISGTVRPLDSHWDYFLWDLKVSTKVPFELV